MFTHAIVRKPGTNFAQGITSSNLGKPDYDRMIRQHQDYIQALEYLGMDIIALEAEPDFPDAYFVEDVAVITPEVAVITNPGADARKGEQDSIEPVLVQFRPTLRIQAPGTVEGGDVLIADQHLFIGISERTNLDGATQLGRILEDYGYTWASVEIAAGLHLKSGVNYVGEGTLLICENFAERDEFASFRKILVPSNETYAANTLWINDHLVMPHGFPETKKRLVYLGMPIIELNVSEAQKMDGGLTCMSLRL